MQKIPVRFAKISSVQGDSQIVAVLQGSDSISLVINENVRHDLEKLSEEYRKMVSDLRKIVSKVDPAQSADQMLQASEIIEQFVGQNSDRFEFVALSESLARDLNLRAKELEADAIVNLVKIVKSHGNLHAKIPWRAFVFVYPAIINSKKTLTNRSLREDLLSIVDKQAALAYKGHSFSAGRHARDLYNVMLAHNLSVK